MIDKALLEHFSVKVSEMLKDYDPEESANILAVALIDQLCKECPEKAFAVKALKIFYEKARLYIDNVYCNLYERVRYERDRAGIK